MVFILTAPAPSPSARGAQGTGSVTLCWEDEPALTHIGPELVSAFAASKHVGAGAIDARPDDLATLGRFADPDSPFDLLLANHLPGVAQSRILERGFPSAMPQPIQDVIGQRRVLVVVNNSNTLEKLSLASLGALFQQTGKAAAWSALGGRGPAVHCYSELKDSWSVDLIRRRCMSFTERLPGYSRRGFRAFRDDMVSCSSAQDVISAVKADAAAIGILQFPSSPVHGVKVIAVCQTNGVDAVSPSLEWRKQEGYPLAESLVLYVHPNAGPLAAKLAEFCLSPEGSAIAARHGLITPYVEWQEDAARRTAQAKIGKGARVSVVGTASWRSVAGDLAREYVKSKAAVQLEYSPAESDVAALDMFLRGAGDATTLQPSDDPQPRPVTPPAPVAAPLPATRCDREMLILSDRPSDQAMKAYGRKWNALQPDEDILAGRAAALIVNSDNKLETLTLDQVRAIYSGEVDDWAVIGGAGFTPGAIPSGISAKPGSIRINALGLPAADPAAALFFQECLPAGKFNRVSFKETTADLVAAVGLDPRAIAFVDLAAFAAAANGRTVKVLGIRLGSGPRAQIVLPTVQNIKDAMYPLSHRIYLYVNPHAGDTAKEYAAFISSCGLSETTPYNDAVKSVMETCRKQGLIPLADTAAPGNDSGEYPGAAKPVR